MDVTTATPVEIDTEIARLNGVIYSAQDRMEKAQGTIERIDEAQGTYHADFSWNSPEKRAEAQATIDAADAEVSDALNARLPLLNEFDRRGGWTRFYLVTNTGGHVHWTTGCGSCFPTTQFAWLVDQSGTSHADLVEQAGSMACTVCFPDAPVDVLRRKGTLEAPEAKAKREEREAAKAARDAKKIANSLTADGSEFRVEYVSYGRPGTERFKTERAAIQWVVQYVSWGHDLDTSDMSGGFAKVIEAVAAKHDQSIDEVRTMINEKVAAKIKRDSRV